MKITEAVERACKEPSLILALSFICLWESERVVKQARQNERWETCFEFCIERVMEEYEKPKAKVNGMKYQDILPDVLDGKFVRHHPNQKWMRMKESGMWDNNPHKPDFILDKDVYLLDTWEVKPQEIYVWGVCHESGKSEIYSKEPVHGSPRDWVSDQASEWLEFGGEKNLFPKDKPKKYKLIPVNEEEKVYRYKYSAVLNETYSSGEEYMCKKYGPGYWDDEFKPQQVIDAFVAGEESMYKKIKDRIEQISSASDKDTILDKLVSLIADFRRNR